MKNMKLWRTAFAFTVASTFICTFLIVQYVRTPVWDVYEGENVFLTEQEYTDFKFAVLDENIQEWEVDALTSRPPIIVKFRIEVPHGYAFNYGERVWIVNRFYDDIETSVWLPIGLMISTLALVYLTIHQFHNDMETNQEKDK